jgi:hypothetical protein
MSCVSIATGYNGEWAGVTMASQYYLQREGQESGPFGFRDLVEFVREGRLADSDLVRYSWTNEWKRADTLVGLFRMALKSPEDLAEPPDLAVDAEAAMNGSRWSGAGNEALSSVTARQSGIRPLRRPGRWRKLVGRLLNVTPADDRDDSWQRIGYRVVCTIVFAAIVAVSVDNWSQQEGRRFLRGESQRETMRLFPVVGKCGTGQYLFLMADLVLATGTITWVTAGWLESHAE